MKKRLLAMMMSVIMIAAMVPSSVIPVLADPTAQVAGSVMQNADQNKGVVFEKSAKPHLDEHGDPDGTVDIVLHAYTTGVVTTTNIITPTDIVLVLDLSGSMDDAQTSTQQTVYTPVYATETLPSGGWWGNDYHTGLNTNSTRYVMNAPDTYVSARRSNNDENGHEVWYYTDDSNSRVYFYPAFEDTSFVPEEPYENTSYPVVQVYTMTTQRIPGQDKIDLLKEAVDEFIANTAEANEGITDTSKMHRISIVKFASDEYADASNLLDEGNDTFRDGGNTYNYSQLVKNLTVVDDAGKAELINAMDSLNPGGATAVDYGMNIATKVFDAQDESEMQGRKKVVIVLTDGSPTYSNSYQAAVAGSAINYAKTLKDEGVTVYTISVEAGADGTQLGSSNSNQFMHYMSSNYPDASYANNTITAGEGSPAGGYYLTPDNANSLEMIFTKISEDIASPTISLGVEATVVDSISEYFTISDPVNGVKVYTADKLAGNAWDAPVESSLVPDITGHTVTVNGFDFDANFVSSEKRIVGGQDFYGRELILVINVTPDYEKIDRHTDDIIANGGYVTTNDGEAEIVKNNEVITKVSSPEIQLNKVTYTVDGADYKGLKYYRLAGSSYTLIDEPTKTGATFSGWTSQTAGVNIANGAFIMPATDVVVEGTFTNINYTVSYDYVGLDLGTSMPALPQSHTAVYGDDVTVEATPTLEGYTFVGWYPQDEALGTGNITAFSMPAHDVVLLGRFVPSEGTKYTVEHYTETFVDGQFELKETENLAGTTGEIATAAAKNYTGFTFDESYTGTVISGTIAADGSLVLKLYYTRNSYEVTYEYVGDKIPTGAAPDGTIGTPIASYTQVYKYGADVTVKADATAPGYTFVGWYSTGGTVAADTISFEMPDHAVTLHGYFTANTNTKYTVEHYFENANDSDYTKNDALTETFNNATTDTTVTALPLNIQGFECDTTVAGTIASGVVNGEGTLTLKLYYKRNTYTVTYDYEGAVPANADPTKAELAGVTANYKWGQTVTVMDAVTPPTNYEFHGWYRSSDASRTNISGTTFTMPQEDVLILGHFDKISGVQYYVEHYFRDVETEEYVHNTAYDETFKGTAGDEVSATPVTVTGYHYNSVHTDNEPDGIIPDPNVTAEPLVLKLYYDLNEYTVTYKFEGVVPSDAVSKKPADETYLFGEEVTAADEVSAAGYTFIGWYRNNDTSKTPITAPFAMPAYDVELVGMFVPNTDTKYTVEHHFENTNGDYVIDSSKTQTLASTTGTSVTATPLGVDGFTYNQAKSESTRTGVIAGDGSTTLKLYYSRDKFAVTYVYTVAPTGAFLPTPHKDVPWGDEVTLKDADDITGYIFSGWSIKDVTVTGGKFEMPKGDVTVVGSYSASDYNYKVEHWVETDSGFELHAEETRVGKMDSAVTATIHVIHGYTYDADVTVSENAANGIEIGDDKAVKFENSERTTLRSVIKNGDLVLAFYYTRNENDVTYVIEGAVKPEGVTVPAGLTDVPFGTNVEVDNSLNNIPGYTFSGWSTEDAELVDGKFSMPDNDVVLTGSFTANEVTYTIKYWQQSLGETGEVEYGGKQYDEVVDDREENILALTGHSVSAYPDYIKTYEGFEVRQDQDKYYGIVEGDGSLVLHVYYDRMTFDVSYIYAGLQPDDAEPIPAGYNKTGVMYGAELDVQAKMKDYDDRKFDGWHSTDVDITNGAVKFNMPAHDVTIYGRYVPADPNDYTVTYFVDGEQYAQYVVKPGEVHAIIGEPVGNTKFKGWSDPLDMAKNRFVVTTDNEFVMPWSDVEIYGEFEAPVIIPRGTLSVTKVAVVPNDFLGINEYIFDIYSVDGNTITPVAVLTLKGGETESIALTPGTYYVSERNASVEGYELVTECSDADGVVTVVHANETEITFTNIYTEIMLQTDDHFAYIVGYPDGTVRPEANITRAEVATIFFRMMTDSARDHYWSTANDFSDVSEGDWYNVAVSTLAKAGVLNGYTDGTFHPNATITRAELVKIATSFYETDAGKTSEFSDIRDHWAEKFIEEAQSLGFVSGYGDGTFHPDQAVTRAEAMKIVNRTLNRAPHKDYLLNSMIRWPDNMDTSKWYYAEVQEATNSHDYNHEGTHEVWTAILPVRDWAALERAWKDEHDGE